MTSTQWFSVDKEGLAKVLGRKGKEFAILELIQNAWDAPGATQCLVQVEPLAGSAGKALVMVEDDSPEGFTDITQAFTLFKDSAKKNDPLLRGRFCIGEKLVLAISESVELSTTRGTLVFDARGRSQKRGTRPRGTRVTCRLRMNREELARTVQCARRLLPPAGMRTVINGMEIPVRKPAAVIPARLRTEKANAAGFLARVERNTEIRVHEAAVGENAMLFELGIPVMETGDRWHYDVAQKIPLTMDREAVAPSFLRDVRLAVFNEMHGLLSAEEINSAWVADLISDPRCLPAAVATYLDNRFTKKRVAFDPSDPEANKLAVARGYVVVNGSMMSGGAWRNAKASALILPAGRVTPSPKPYSPDGTPLTLVPEPSRAMRQVESYTHYLGRELLASAIEVTFALEPQWPFAATYGPGRMTYNVGRLGHAWFDLKHNRRAINQLIIHELGHHFSSDHLSEDYHDALCRIGASLAELDLKAWLEKHAR